MEPARPQHPALGRLQMVDRGRYTPREMIGQGGVGQVYLAHDERLDRDVAIKELRTNDPGSIDRFTREAFLTARLQHPAIIPIYEAGRWSDSGTPFYAMKFVSGRTLGQIVVEASIAARLERLPSLLAVAEAIAYAHQEGIVHRDLKPANVLVGAFGETWIIDWGLGKALDVPEESRDEWRDRAVSGEGLTMDGAVMGTPAYMPPEQALGRPVDRRADVYAIGAMLYHALSGGPPYAAASSQETLTQVLAGEPLPLVRREPGLPAELLAIVGKAMARLPEDRYPDARGLADDLRRFLRGQLVQAHTYSSAERFVRLTRRHGAALRAAAVALLVVVGTGTLSLARVFEARRVAEQERDRAEVARRDAVRGGEEAEAAQRVATERADELALQQARGSLTANPNATLAWLKQLSPAFRRWGEARLLAADALERGPALTLRGHQRALNAVTFAHDGALATTSDDHTVRLWSPEGRLERVLAGHPDEAWGARFTEDGKSLVSCGKDGSIIQWDRATGQPTRLGEMSSGVRLLRLTPDSRWGVAVSGEESWLLGLQDGSIHPLPGAHVLSARPAFSADGTTLAVLHTAGLRVWRIPEGTARSFPDRTAARTARLPGSALSADGRLFAVGSEGNSVMLWDTQTGARRALLGHDGPVWAAAFSPDGHTLATGGEDSDVVVWDVARGALRGRFSGHQGPILGLQFSPDGERIATGSADHTVRLLDLPSGKSRSLAGFASSVPWLAFSEDGSRLAAGGIDPTARVFLLAPRAASTPRSPSRPSHPAPLLTAPGPAVSATSPDGLVASVVGDRSIQLTNPTTGATRQLGVHEGPITALRFSPDGQQLASGSRDHAIRLWRLDTGEAIHLEGGGPVQDLRFTPAPEGRRLLAIVSLAMVQEWDASTGAPRRTLRGHTGAISCFDLSRDGARLVTGGMDHTVRLWDLESGASRVLSGHDHALARVAFSPEGGAVLSVDTEGVSRRWVDDLPLDAASLRLALRTAVSDEIDLGQLDGAR
jgi:WD40 repeat protein/predicted Ser/Thr protein kinase